METPPDASTPPARPAADPLVVFDGDCGLCDRTVDWLVARDARARLRFTPRGSAAARARLARVEGGAAVAGDASGDGDGEAPDGLLLLEDGRLYRASDAAVRIAAHLDPPWSFARHAARLPRALRESAYAFVARNRYRFFGRISPERAAARGRRLAERLLP